MRGKCKYTLVQDPKGNLHAVSLTEPPLRVKNQKEVKNKLDSFDQILSDIIILEKGGRLVAGSGVHVSASDIFPK